MNFYIVDDDPEVLTILSGRESSVRRLDLLREALGDDPADWFPALTDHAWPGGRREPDLGYEKRDPMPFRQAAE